MSATTCSRTLGPCCFSYYSIAMLWMLDIGGAPEPLQVSHERLSYLCQICMWPEEILARSAHTTSAASIIAISAHPPQMCQPIIGDCGQMFAVAIVIPPLTLHIIHSKYTQPYAFCTTCLTYIP